MVGFWGWAVKRACWPVKRVKRVKSRPLRLSANLANVSKVTTTRNLHRGTPFVYSVRYGLSTTVVHEVVAGASTTVL